MLAPVVPFLKRAGFLASDGTPTGLYKRFKNKSAAGGAAAEALRHAYASLYEINEYAHDLNDDKLRGVILQVTGLEAKSSLIRKMVGSFKALKAFADFDAPESDDEKNHEEGGAGDGGGSAGESLGLPGWEFRLGYTINLNLPATTDITVFNAIFRSLREHLL